MALNKGMMESVKGNAEEIRQLIAKIPDEPRKQAALRYCDDCIAATSLVLELLEEKENSKKKKDAEKKQSVKQEAAVDLFAEQMDLF